MRFIKHSETRSAIGYFLSDKNISMLKAKAKIIADIASIIKEKP
jgi:hypothetical protein